MEKTSTNKSNCKHPIGSVYKKVISAVVCCETVVAVCGECGQHLSPPSVEC